MKNNGYYSGPKSVFYGNDGNDAPRYSANTCTIYYNQDNLMRRKICNVEVKPNTHHTIRLRSVLTSSESGNFTLDYMELVPIDICGAGGLGEDFIDAPTKPLPPATRVHRPAYPPLLTMEV